MKVVVTAGGTVEPIDEVRSISNRSTGRLAKAIAESLLALGGDSIEELYYLHGPGAAAPEDPRVRLVAVGRVRELEAELGNLLRANEVGAIIHAMAVSDFSVSGVATMRQRARAAAGAVSLQPAAVTAGERALSGLIARALRSSPRIRVAKLSSDLDAPILFLDRIPKVIASLRAAAPRAAIVGFKLLAEASEAELIAAGQRLLESTDCTYVFANDARDSFGRGYAGFLLGRGGARERLEGLQGIARRIAEAALAGAGVAP
jgi:phosphopantothenate-cysteine ligase